MNPVYICNYCKEPISVIGGNVDLSVLEHLSQIHGVVIKESPDSDCPKEEEDRLTAYLESIKGSKINN